MPFLTEQPLKYIDGRTGRGGNHALYFLTALIGNQVLLQRASQATHKGDIAVSESTLDSSQRKNINTRGFTRTHKIPYWLKKINHGNFISQFEIYEF